MDIEKFITDRPFLYHLTCKENAENIIATKQLLSANELIRLSGNAAYRSISRQRRPLHQEIILDGKGYFLRDQRPISLKNLAKCLTDGWDVGDFIHHLNNRVFMWPTIGRLWAHYNRYVDEQPVIFRFSTRELLAANTHVRFCRLNSGATRSNAKYEGAPPERGPRTFLPAAEFHQAVREVAEVTFEKRCQIAGSFGYSNNPEGRFNTIKN